MAKTETASRRDLEFTGLSNRAIQKLKPVPLTTTGSHRATERGFGGAPDPHIIEPGEIVPAGTPVSKLWMEPVAATDIPQAEGDPA